MWLANQQPTMITRRWREYKGKTIVSYVPLQNNIYPAQSCVISPDVTKRNGPWGLSNAEAFPGVSHKKCWLVIKIYWTVLDQFFHQTKQFSSFYTEYFSNSEAETFTNYHSICIHCHIHWKRTYPLTDDCNTSDLVKPLWIPLRPGE